MSKLICFYEFITLNTQKTTGVLQMATENSKRLLVTDEMICRADEKLDSLVAGKKTTATAAVQKLKTKIIGLRKKGISIREIADALRSTGIDVSDSLVSLTCGPLQKREKTIEKPAKIQTAKKAVEAKSTKPVETKREIPVSSAPVTAQKSTTKLVGNADYDPAASLKI